LWQGTAESVVDLHPAGYDLSSAKSVAGGSQVGWGRTTGGDVHALLWQGTAESFVDLHPAGFDFSEATGISGGSQVGFGGGSATGDDTHALLWQGTAASVVDLHPAWSSRSEATGVSGSIQVGAVFDGFNTIGCGPLICTGHTHSHAYLWQGTADSAIDLHPFLEGLGPEFYESFATGIDANGNIVGYAKTASGESYAVLWRLAIPGDFDVDGDVDAADYVVWRKTDGSPAGYNAWRSHFGEPAGSGSGASANAAVPEPATLTLLMFAAAGWCLRRGRAA
jgi:hypothetical protein